MKQFQEISSLDEIVFENRNRSYGAYELRANQGRNLSAATLLTMGLVSALVLIAIGVGTVRSEAELIDLDGQLVITELYFPPVAPPVDLPPQQPEPERQEQQSQSSTGSYTANDNAEKQETKTNDQLAISTVTNTKGSDSAAARVADPPVIITPPVVSEAVVVADVMPSFPALYQFISRNIRFPEAARSARVGGTIYVSFIVEKDGSISSVAAQNSPGYGLKEEAERVVSSMKGWTPGAVKGNPVRVKCILPIKFTVQ